MPIKDQPKDGRTSGYDVGIAEIAETICERLVNGESLKAMCRSRDDFERRRMEMSTEFRLLQTVRACDLFDGRLEEFGVREHVKPDQTTKKTRCLTDGCNYLWVYIDGDDFVSYLKRYAPNGDPSEILDAISVALDTDIASEYEPQYWGFDTQKEWDAAMKRLSREEDQRERRLERERLKYLQGEPNKIKPGTSEMRKVEIAKKLVEKDPSLLLPENRHQLRKEIVSAEIADMVRCGEIPF